MNKIVGVVLAAGLGMRLRPSTEKCPKPLIPVGGVEPLFFAVYKLSEMGVRRVVINSHHLVPKVKAAVESWKKFFPEIEFRLVVEEPEILGTGGAIINIIKKNSDWFADPESSLLLQNGDTLAQFDLSQLTVDHSQSTLAVSLRASHLEKYNPLWIDQAKDYSGIGKEPKFPGLAPAHFLGVHHLSKDAVRDILQGQEFVIQNIDLFNGIYKPLQLRGHRFRSIEFFKHEGLEEFWFDMTTQEFLLEAQRYVLDSMLNSETWIRVLKKRFPLIREHAPGVWVESVKFQRDEWKSKVVFKSPVVFVETASSQKSIQFNHLTLGPHASLIHEHGVFDLGVAHSKSFEVVNSVLFSDSEERNSIPSEKIMDQICVL